MFGIIDKATGRVYAKDKSQLKMIKMLELIEERYPKQWFTIVEVADDAILVGQESSIKKSE